MSSSDHINCPLSHPTSPLKLKDPPEIGLNLRENNIADDILPRPLENIKADPNIFTDEDAADILAVAHDNIDPSILPP